TVRYPTRHDASAADDRAGTNLRAPQYGNVTADHNTATHCDGRSLSVRACWITTNRVKVAIHDDREGTDAAVIGNLDSDLRRNRCSGGNRDSVANLDAPPWEYHQVRLRGPRLQ